MMADRRTQPYRATKPRLPGITLDNMRRGRSVYGYNPADLRRAIKKMRRR